jgi:NitT/TauT family transport system ATP-binding protein
MTNSPVAEASVGHAEINIKNLSKTFHAKSGDVHALANINLNVAAGEFISIVGPSGCGKTTLLRILAGLDTQSEGTASVGSAEAGSSRESVGVVFQRPVLLPWRTVLDNVLLPIELDHRPTRAERESATEILRLVGLGEFLKKYPGQLSGGMQQRVAICRALVHDPKVLLMDEPFGALDAMTRDSLNVEVNRIWRTAQKTAVLITHSIPEAVFLSQRVVVMGPRPGRIIEIVDVPFGPERKLELLGTPEFAKLSAYIRAFFKGDTNDD